MQIKFLNVCDKKLCCVLTDKFKHVLLCKVIEVFINVNALQN